MLDAAIAQASLSIPRENTISKLKDWLHANLVETTNSKDDEKSSRHLCLRKPRNTTWAFMSWEV